MNEDFSFLEDDFNPFDDILTELPVDPTPDLNFNSNYEFYAPHKEIPDDWSETI